MSAGYQRCLQYRPADLLSVFWQTGHVAAPLQSSTVYWSKFAPSAERGILNDGQPGVQPPLPMPAPTNNYVPFSERLLGGHSFVAYSIFLSDLKYGPGYGITRFEQWKCLLGEVAGTAVYRRYWLLSSSGSAAVNGCQRDYNGVISGLVKLGLGVCAATGGLRTAQKLAVRRMFFWWSDKLTSLYPNSASFLIIAMPVIIVAALFVSGSPTHSFSTISCFLFLFSIYSCTLVSLHLAQ
ncbi:hypothetical protein BDP27DRAFT_1405233 [Rhodocollybia butyracea]|uniref:Uncharacterized protein n=1 Tax=Rhodocollybia butyracea TaxID=206335 RepID=A0A9P5PG29_9AGAR|nr:hypothetical protein BDP27DRAFT_1405233 [Rhodocollybia butyracea]